MSKKLNIIHDSFDKRKFNEIFFQSKLKDTITNNMKELNTVAELTEDNFNTLFKYSPQLYDKDEINSNFHINRVLTEKVMESAPFRALRAYTKLNEVNSAIASSTLTENIIKENQDLIKKIKEQQKQIQKDRNALKKMNQEHKRMKKSRKKSSKKSTGKKSSNKKSSQGKKRAPKSKAQKELEKRMSQKISQIKKNQSQQQKTAGKLKVSKAVKNTSNSIKAQSDMMNDLGMGCGEGAGEPGRVSLDTRLKFMKMFTRNDKFKKMMRMFGRMKRLAMKKQKEKLKHVIETIDDIVPSNNLNRVIPSEFSNLVDPDLEVLFDIKYLSSQLLSYQFTGKETKQTGPIIVCLDVSGSMQGSRDETAKSVTLALTFIAKKQKRDACVILFDGRIQKIYDFKLKEFKTEDAWLDQITDMGSFFSGGGTDFNYPLSKSIEKFKEKEFKKADLVFITDGEANLSDKNAEEFNKLRKEKGISCYSIIIDSYHDKNHVLKKISNKLVSVSELTDEVASDLFESI